MNSIGSIVIYGNAYTFCDPDIDVWASYTQETMIWQENQG